MFFFSSHQFLPNLFAHRFQELLTLSVSQGEPTKPHFYNGICSNDTLPSFHWILHVIPAHHRHYHHHHGNMSSKYLILSDKILYSLFLNTTVGDIYNRKDSLLCPSYSAHFQDVALSICSSFWNQLSKLAPGNNNWSSANILLNGMLSLPMVSKWQKVPSTWMRVCVTKCVHIIITVERERKWSSLCGKYIGCHQERKTIWLEMV